MGLSIKRAETERKARAVAECLGVSLTEAIDIALDKTWRELAPSQDENADRLRRREALFARIRARGAGDGRDLKVIEAEVYGDDGQPI
ncbi:MAG: type II toxin-antitoxin system VapB family antitoxin [Brevundimonas sp.]|uniref:type II toxin-antitoxin system VapB family antitoxin n=1 Tax=Brevundimonas sp. TaxID=1871086 RepID=UPI0025BD5E20|nr:type II toxin-antitoxin system VapB family antitoxin [Brevundimonas sp.]MBX3477639.1 type II toxin-antitoxin system VapB family antitoxin [Brevundimonas sp.]